MYETTINISEMISFFGEALHHQTLIPMCVELSANQVVLREPVILLSRIDDCDTSETMRGPPWKEVADLREPVIVLTRIDDELTPVKLCVELPGNQVVDLKSLLFFSD